MLKEKLKLGEPAIGTALIAAAADNAEVLALAGLDFLVIHHDQGADSIAALLARLKTVKGAQCTAIVRLPGDDPALLAPVRAAGAGGIIVPGIASAEAARNLVAACRAGEAGAPPLFIAVQAAGCAAVSEIAAVAGIDLVLIDPCDGAAEGAIRRSGKPLAAMAADGTAATALFRRGYAFVIAGSDMMLLDAGAAALLSAARGFVPPGPVAQPIPAGVQRDANTSIRRMRQFWVAWCVAVLLLGAAVVGFGTLFALSDAWEPWAKISGRIAAGLLAVLAVYDAYRIATRGTAALQEVLAQNLASIVVAELERLHAATAQRKLALSAKAEPGALGLSLDSLSLDAGSFDGEDVRNLLGNPTEAALRDVLASIAAYNRLIDTLATGDTAAEGGLLRQIEEISEGINRAMASVAGRLQTARQAAAH